MVRGGRRPGGAFATGAVRASNGTRPMACMNEDALGTGPTATLQTTYTIEGTAQAAVAAPKPALKRTGSMEDPLFTADADSVNAAEPDSLEFHCRTVRRLSTCATTFEAMVDNEVNDALEELSESQSVDERLPNALIEPLRSKGLDVRMEQGGGTASSEPTHTFLIAVPPGAPTSERVLIEPAFKAHFRLGRATAPYERILEYVPEVVCANEERFRALVEFLCERLASSFTESGMETPPWRRTRAVLSKWRIAQRSNPSNRCASLESIKQKPKVAKVAARAEAPQHGPSIARQDISIHGANLMGGVRS